MNPRGAKVQWIPKRVRGEALAAQPIPLPCHGDHSHPPRHFTNRRRVHVAWRVPPVADSVCAHNCSDMLHPKRAYRFQDGDVTALHLQRAGGGEASDAGTDHHGTALSQRLLRRAVTAAAATTTT